MKSTQRLRINTPMVINQVIDGEAVIINLETGNYYSLDQVGVDVWSQIESGATVEEINEVICRRYYGSSVEIGEAVNRLIDELKQENLVAPADVHSVGLAGGQYLNGAFKGDRLVFKAPSLQKYTDMQDLLLLDPIHDVDDVGWPSRKAAV